MIYKLSLVLIWLVLLVILPWRGHYFLNDDIYYEWNVRNFSERGLNLHAFTAPTMIFQLIIGVLTYGISEDPSLLRLLTSLFYLIGVIYMFMLLILERVPQKMAFFLSLLFMFNPIYLYLGFTYMSDVYFLTPMLISLYYFTLYAKDPVKKGQLKNLFISMLFLTFAFLSRQQAIIIIPVYLLADLFILRRRTFIGYSMYLLPVLTFVVYQLFIPKSMIYMEGSLFKTLDSLVYLNTYFVALERSVKSLFYLGFYSIPVTLPFIAYFVLSKKFFRRRYVVGFMLSVLILIAAAGLFWVRDRHLMFYIPNIVTYAGFLPASIHLGIKQTIFVGSPVRVQALITLASIVSFGGLILIILNNITSVKRVKEICNEHLSLTVLFVSSLLTMGTFFVFRSFYDRYMLIMLPLLILMLGLFSGSFKKYLKVMYLLLAGFILMTVVFEHDYLTLNRTLWEVPEQYGIDKMDYRGSFEFNRYHRLDLVKDVTDYQVFLDREWIPAAEEYEYYISYMELPDYCIAETINYRSYLSPDLTGSLVLLTRNCSLPTN